MLLLLLLLLLPLVLLQLLECQEYDEAGTAGSFCATIFLAQPKCSNAGCRPMVAAQPGYQRRTPASLPLLGGRCHQTTGALWQLSQLRACNA